MPAIITSAIEESSFEKVRDRVAQILSLELPVQEYLSGFELPGKAWLERVVPFDEATELPAVNVSIATMDFSGQTVRQSDNTITLNIDLYTEAASTPSEQADTEAAIKMHRLARFVRGILEHTAYKTLGFTPPFIMNRHIASFGYVKYDEQDASSGFFGRLILSVKVSEANGVVTATPLNQSLTEVKLNTTNKGFYYEVQSS